MWYIGSIGSSSSGMQVFKVILNKCIHTTCLITYIDVGPSIFLCQVFHITYILVHVVKGGWRVRVGVGDVLASNSQPF